jgi:hypothetical protein
MFVHRIDNVIIGSGANPQTDRSPELADENNAEWVAYLESQSNPAITQVSRAQGTAQLQLSGYWDTVVTLVEAIPDPSTKIIAKQALYAANTWQKSSPTMQLLAGKDGLNLTQQQFDDLFINANQIQL